MEVHAGLLKFIKCVPKLRSSECFVSFLWPFPYKLKLCEKSLSCIKTGGKYQVQAGKEHLAVCGHVASNL